MLEWIFVRTALVWVLKDERTAVNEQRAGKDPTGGFGDRGNVHRSGVG